MPMLSTPKGVLLLMLITLLGLIGVMLVLLLGWTWRRFNARLQAPPPKPTRMPDIWQAGGIRLNVDKVFPRDPPEPPEPPQAKDEDDDDGPQPPESPDPPEPHSR
jgi:hypothetical protein